jgi:hypothetical protein
MKRGRISRLLNSGTEELGREEDKEIREKRRKEFSRFLYSGTEEKMRSVGCRCDTEGLPEKRAPLEWRKGEGKLLRSLTTGIANASPM